MKNSIQDVKVGTNRAHVEWIPVYEIVPNPLNPRKNDGVKTDELQEILRQGWEMPITAYKKGSVYVVLSGHRRLYAARQMKIAELPVFIVEPPKSHQDELNRIARAQLAQEDWTSLEWAKFSYERWLALGKPGMSTFAKMMKLKKGAVESYIKVLDYFPIDEIEAGLNNKQFSISYLFEVVGWLRKIKSTFPKLVESLTEDLMRRITIGKILDKKVSKEAVHNRSFLDTVSEEDLKMFFLDKEMDLAVLMAKYEFNVKERSFHAQLVSIGLARRAVKQAQPKNEEEAKKALEALKEIQDSLTAQFKSLEKKYPDITKKDTLFEW